MLIDEETFASILAAVGAGEPVGKVLDGIKVDRTSFYGKLASAPEAAERYARAKQTGLERVADEAMELADQEPSIVSTDKGGDHYDPAHVQWLRLRIDTRKWLLSKLAPKKYGERTLIGSDPDNPIPPMVILGAHGEPAKD